MDESLGGNGSESSASTDIIQEVKDQLNKQEKRVESEEEAAKQLEQSTKKEQ